MNKKIILSLALTLLLTTISTAAVYVPADYTAIQAAINAADDGNEIIVGDGTVNISAENPINTGGKAITVRSQNGPANCIIECSQVERAFLFDSGETEATVIRGFTIQNGRSTYGGAIECEGASPTIDNCIITGSTAAYGGAIDIFYGSPVIKNCIITGNNSDYDGSAIECGGDGTPQILNSLIYENTAGGYGAIDCYDLDSLDIINCTIANNSGAGNIGGIYSTNSTVTMRNSILWNNGDDLAGTGITSSYSCIEDGDSGIANISSDPMFRTGPAGNYYLSQTLAGQLETSECVNGGMEDVENIFGPVNTHSYTTATNNFVDGKTIGEKKVDIGFHYVSTGTPTYYILTPVIDPPGSGTITKDPNSASYVQYAEVQLEANPIGDNRFTEWRDANTSDLGTYNTTLNNIFVITMNNDKTVTAKFDTTDVYKLISYVVGGNGVISSVTPNYSPDPEDPRAYYIPQGTDPTITVSPNPGYVVKQWLKGDTELFDINDPSTYAIIPPSGDSLTTSIDANTTITVEFKYQQYLLTTSVDATGHGTIMPKRGWYPAGTTVNIVATPEDGYRVEKWLINLVDVGGWNTPTNSVVMDANKTVSVKFQTSTNKVIHVPGTYPYVTIQDAIDIAQNGDTIKIAPGTYPGTGFSVNKSITIVGNPVNPETVVIDGNNFNNRLFNLGNAGVVTLNGLTIANAKYYGRSPLDREDPWDSNTNFRNDGASGNLRQGAGIFVNGSHIITNCIIRNCIATGGDARDGYDGNLWDLTGHLLPIHKGGYGGRGGNAEGAGIYILSGNPIIKNTIVDGCRALGGNGGNGGIGLAASTATPFDPNFPGGPGGNGGNGGDALGAGIYCKEGSNPTFIACTVKNCEILSGYGGDGGLGGIGARSDQAAFDPCNPAFFIQRGYGQGGHAGMPGLAYGGGIYIDDLCIAKFESCKIIENSALGNVGGSGGNSSGNIVHSSYQGQGGVGALVDIDTLDRIIQNSIWDANNVSNGAIDPNNLILPNQIHRPAIFPMGMTLGQIYAQIIPISPEVYTAKGGGIYIGGFDAYLANASAGPTTADFNNCEIIDNQTKGSTSGIGGYNIGNLFNHHNSNFEYPSRHYRMPSYGNGVYLADNSTATFLNSNVEGNYYTIEETQDIFPLAHDQFIVNNLPVAGHPGTDLGIYNLIYGDEYVNYGGGLCVDDLSDWITQTTIKGCNIADNNSATGGGIYANTSKFQIIDSDILNNHSFSGGGILVVDSNGSITNSLVKGNTAGIIFDIDQGLEYALYGTGGGVYALSSLVNIYDSVITENIARATGGGICFDGDWWAAPTMKPLIKNCLITDNNAVYEGGGIAAIYFAEPIIQNCTIAENIASDANGTGGGLFASYMADVIVKDSILWENNGSFGSQIALSSGGPYTGMPSSLKISYSDIDLSSSMPLYRDDPTCSVVGLARDLSGNWSVQGSSNISADPLFVAGYYLSNSAVIELALHSPCIDAGSAAASTVGMDVYTTRLDGEFDSGIVDIGYHYKEGLAECDITVRVVDDSGNPINYSVIVADPNSRIDDGSVLGTYIFRFYQGIDVTLTSVSDANHYLRGWYTPSGTLISASQTYAFNPNSDAEIIARIKPRRTIHIPGDYPYTNIQQAINDAQNGDVIVIASGNYIGTGFQVIDKDITITSANPNDRATVENTVIDCSGNVGGGFRLYSTTGTGSTVLNGLTIINAHSFIVAAEDGEDPGDNGYDGGWHFGQAIRALGNHKILNCIIRNATNQGAEGGDGANGDSNSMTVNGGRGGEGGDALGAGILIYGGSPLIQNCLIEDCTSTGGNGGNGGNGNNDSERITSGVGGRGGYAGKAYGAGIACYDGSKPTIKDCIIRNCLAIAGRAGNGGNTGEGRGSGGFGGLADADPQQDEPTNHSAYGGGLYIGRYCDATVVNCTIEDNTTEGSVSGLGGESYNGVQQLPHQNFRIASYGGGVYCDTDSNTSFVKCNIQDNNTTIHDNYYVGHGGGIAFNGGVYAELIDCNVIANAANVGGGFYSNDLADFVIDGSKFLNNNAYLGGGLFTIYGSADINNCQITSNIADWYGNEEDPNADPDSIFGSGGGIYAFSTDSTVRNSLITANTASSSGGGIYFGGSQDSNLFNCLITKNRADNDGAGVSVNWFADVDIQNCTIAENLMGSVYGHGGGLYCAYEGFASVLDTIFRSNTGIEGSQIAIGGGNTAYALPGFVDIRYSNVDLRTASAFSSLSQVSSSTSTPSGSILIDETTIFNQLSSTGSANIIVSLTEPSYKYQITDWSNTNVVQQLRTQIATLQNQVLSTFDTGEFTVKQQLTNSATISGTVTQAGFDKLLANPNVAHIEPVRTMHYALAQGLPLMNAFDTRTQYSGTGISIAIVDSGVDYRHPQLGGGIFPNSKVVGGYDTGENDGDPMPFGEAHGTNCAGISAGLVGMVNDYIGGVAPNAKIYALKGSRDSGALYTNDLIAAWDWCITHKNDNPQNPIMVISNSWGGGIYSSAVEADADNPSMVISARTAKLAGITVLAASGNDGFIGGISAPAALSDVISVGAVYDASIGGAAFVNCTDSQTAADKVTCYSNTADFLDILAPSHNAYTTDIVGPSGYSSGDYYAQFGGTSAACPYAAGAAAVLQSAAKQLTGHYLTPDQVKTILAMSGDPITDTKAAITKPRVNLGAAIVLMGESTPIYIEPGVDAGSLQGFISIADEWIIQPGSNNLAEDPCFVFGYYLSHTDAGQDSDSNCFDIGPLTAEALGLDDRTTRTDNFKDEGLVDMGYHYVQGLKRYTLHLEVNIAEANGITEPAAPGDYNYYDGEIATIEATPGENSRVAKWIIDGIEIETHSRFYEIKMSRNHSVTVVFEFYTPSNLIVPDQYATIQEAIDAAEDGDKIYIYRKSDGQPHYISDIDGLDLQGKEITIRSENPDDPNIVAATVIDCRNRGRAFIFQNGENENSIIDGLTIINGLASGPIATGVTGIFDPCDPNIYYYNGNDASGDGFGGAIYLDANTSPIIRNCVFTNCQVTGGQGADGIRGYNLAGEQDTRDRGGRGGDGGNGAGNGFGGAIFCDTNSTPQILDCKFNLNAAKGGIGGNGGNGGNGSSGKIAGDGGNGGTGYGNGYGGTIYCSDRTSVKIIGCTFNENIASLGVGGAAGIQGIGQVATQAPYPHDGVTGGSGGTGFGGVIYYEQGASADINDCRFLNNVATATIGNTDSGGGAMYFEPNCVSIKVIKSNLAGNQATVGSGGAILLGANNKFYLENSFLGGNFANVNGGAIAVGSKTDANDCNLTFTNCAFTGNSANELGGGIYAKNSQAYLRDCFINRNTAHSGGGLNFVAESTLQVIGGTIMQNKAIGQEAEGGGAMILHLKAEFINCQITGNSSNFAGGGLMFKGLDTTGSRVHNCLLAENIANVRGGGIVATSNANIAITSCTFSKNETEVGGAGGGVFCTYTSSPIIKDCIFDRTKRIAIYENSLDCEPVISYCFFNANYDGDYYDFRAPISASVLYDTYNTSNQNDPDGTGLVALNLHTAGNNKRGKSAADADPINETIFRSGSLGDYYLKQQPYDDNIGAIDAGSALLAKTVEVIPNDTNMGDYTTRFDSNQPDHPDHLTNPDHCTYDQGRLDIGFHYIDTDNAAKFLLETKVSGGQGTIKPPTGYYYAGITVQLTGKPGTGWRVKQWSGTDDDSTTNTTNYVVMISDRNVSVSFEQPKNIYLPAEYTTIQEAINDAKSGDKIIISQGTYGWADTNFDYAGIRIWGKNITITSTNPDDPCVVAATIFRGSRFDILNVDQSMILDGITIAEAHYTGGNPRCPQSPISPDGINGYSILGGAMQIVNASPTIRNVRFVNCSASGGDGTDNCSSGGDGGWAGFAWGGAVGIDSASSPIFKNCQFINCIARGGNGGNGDGSEQTPGHGGNWGDPNGDVPHTWDQGDGLGPNGGYAPYWFYSGYGGAIYASVGSKPQFEKCVFSGNRAFGGVCGTSGPRWPWPQSRYVIDSFGGAVYLAAGSEAKFTDCNFVDNLADTRNQVGDANLTYSTEQDGWTLSDPVVSYGGAICAEGTAIPVVNNSTFTNNIACAGGAMYWEDSIAHISESIFNGNSSMLGGAMLLIDSNSAISECDFTGNTAVSPAGQGGAIYCASSSAKFYDCQLISNHADVSGGGAYFSGELEPNMHNCLIIRNSADRDGGGISANWDAQLWLSVCTLANNEVTDGFGGGLSCAYEANTRIINSILWNNSAEYGSEISIGNNFDAADKRMAEVTVTYSNVQRGAAGIFYDQASGCRLYGFDEPSTNLTGTSLSSPSFMSRLGWGDYFLSAKDTNDPHDPFQIHDSNCINAGFGTALSSHMYKHTTRTDLRLEIAKPLDAAKVDMGYHYTRIADITGDYDFDGDVDGIDFIAFLQYWMQDNCEFPYFCHGRDLTEDGEVDFEDFAKFAENFNQTETTPPQPNPMTWEKGPRSTGPTAITMIASTATDNSGSVVEYEFECVYGGGHSRTWDTNSTYVDNGLTSGSQYGYRVRARDKRDNKTEWSTTIHTVAGGDTTPPSPDPMTWLAVPLANSSTSIIMTATTASDTSGPVEYFFEETSGNPGGDNSGWISSSTYEDAGLTPNTTYTYRVQARDNSANQNETDFSTEASAATPDEGSTGDTEPPTPNPSQWEITPRVVPSGITYRHTMTAVTATDATPPVEYYFECVSGGGSNSGWISTPSYTVYDLWAPNHSAYKVRTRDALGNIGEWSITWHTYEGPQ